MLDVQANERDTVNNLEALELARKARADKILNTNRRDSVTGEVFTILERLERGAYAYRTKHVQKGKRVTYGLILANEVQWASDPIGAIDYMTPVCNSTKIGFDYASELPVITVDEDSCRMVWGDVA